jgi:hypothetical protein
MRPAGVVDVDAQDLSRLRRQVLGVGERVAATTTTVAGGDEHQPARAEHQLPPLWFW